MCEKTFYFSLLVKQGVVVGSRSELGSETNARYAAQLEFVSNSMFGVRISRY